LKINSGGIKIISAVIVGTLDLRGQEIPYDVYLSRCTFDDVDLSDAHFAKSLRLIKATFTGMALFDRAIIAWDFDAGLSRFASEATFQGMRTGGDFGIAGTTFDTKAVLFSRVRVGGAFTADDSRFSSGYDWFDEMRVEGDFSADGCTFGHREGAAKEAPQNGEQSTVSFVGSHFGNVFLNDCTFDRISIIDFSGMHADLNSLDIILTEPSEIKHDQIKFKLIRPMDYEKLRFLLSPYDPQFYTDVETSLRTHGYPDEADKIFIAKKRAERRKDCQSFLHQCGRGAWALSMFQDMLLGYGKSLQNLLYWSLGFLIIGTFVFRSEKGMRTKDWKEAPHYAGKYRAFWYSLDLFLPVIKLGEADIWTPKDNRRWAIFYKRVHIIIGSLFVPIGLAALTGIIK